MRGLSRVPMLVAFFIVKTRCPEAKKSGEGGQAPAAGEEHVGEDRGPERTDLEEAGVTYRQIKAN